MERSEIKALYYICPIRNLDSILRIGILSHNKVKKMHPESIADPIIQERRENVVIPGANKKLHDYANLYFNPRNAMMFKVRNLHKEICVLRISDRILDAPSVIITDRNASSGYTTFYDSPIGLVNLQKTLTFIRDWRHPDQFEYWRRKGSVCAEILVPNNINASFINGIIVSCNETQLVIEKILESLKIDISVKVHAFIFFL